MIAANLLAGAVVLALISAAWLAVKANIIKSELEAATHAVTTLKENIAANNPDKARATADRLRTHTSRARDAAGDPVWMLASAVPGIGTSISAVSEVARSADDVATLGVSPLVGVFESLNWDNLVPSDESSSLEPLRKAAPTVTSAAHAVRASAERLQRIDVQGLLPQVAEPLEAARDQLRLATVTLDASAHAAQLAPAMLGADGPRSYLLMIQNNAEARASGGIPGALAVLSVDEGKLSLDAQSGAGDVGVMTPPWPVDLEQQQIYSSRLGKYMQDVNLTPDFPTAAATAQGIWEKRSGQRIDGVVSIDPVALSYILDATGPVKLDNPEVTALASGLPTELNGQNVVSTLLSDVYAKIEKTKLQDAYFAGVAQEIFRALASGQGDAKSLLNGLARASAETRLLVWSDKDDEQKIITRYPLSGAISGPSIAPAQFGVYFNDGTGAKMDYYVKRTVQLIQECPQDGYLQIKVRVTSTNKAPLDAATSLPPYVTGAGAFGVPPGTVQTNIVAYGPVQSNVESVVADGKKVNFASQLHSGRPVGTITVVLPPAKSSTIDFIFGKIVQHTEPKLSVTPTVQPMKDVVLDPLTEKCVPAP